MAAIVIRPYIANGLNQYTSVSGVTHTHDSFGNLTSDGSRNFTYDTENRLLTVSGSASVTLSYDPLVRGGKQVTVGGQTWIYPSEGQCLQCHTEAAGRSLGLETRRLAFNITYPQTGRDAHQLVTLNAINALTPPIANPTDEIPYHNPAGTAGTLGERARAYLHTNCAQCHRPGGPTTSNMDLRYATALADTNACDVVPGLGNLGITDARLIAPGSPDRSVLPARMNVRGAAEAMPPVGSARVDTDGVALIRNWISSLANCN